MSTARPPGGEARRENDPATAGRSTQQPVTPPAGTGPAADDATSPPWEPDEGPQEVDAIDATTGRSGWPTPIGIDGIDRTPLPASAGRQPAALWAFVDAVAEALQVPRDLVFLMVLSILSTASGGRWRVRVRPDWRETLALYTVTAMPSGSLKSATVAAVAAPLYELEDELLDTEGPQIQRRQAMRELRQAEVERLKRKGTAAESELLDAIAAVEEVPPAVAPQLLADDVPPEKLGIIMSEQGGRIGIISSEGGLFAMLAGRYSSGVPNLDLVLKAHSGDRSRSDRVTREAVRLKEPFLAIGVTPQPDVLEACASNSLFRGSGLLARFLYALPATLLGHRNLNPQPIPEHISANYHRHVRALAKTAHERDTTTELTLTDPAAKLLAEFRAAHEPRLDPEIGELADMLDWGSKLAGALARVAALFTLFSDPTATVIDDTAMRTALNLEPYLTDHARATFDIINGRHARINRPRAVLAWIRRKRLKEFTVRQARRDLAGQDWAKDVANVRDALDELEELGWIRKHLPPPDAEPGPGRPKSERYAVNPAAHRTGRVLSIPSTPSDTADDAVA